MSDNPPSLQTICLLALYEAECNDPRYIKILSELDAYYTLLLKEALPEEVFPQHTFVLKWFCEYFKLLE